VPPAALALLPATPLPSQTPDDRALAADETPNALSAFVTNANAALAARNLPCRALFPPDDAPSLRTGVAALSLTPVHNFQAVQRYYAYETSKYDGAGTETL